MNQIIKLSMVVAIATLITACGGGSNDEPEKGIISTGDSDKCIKIPVHPELNVKFRTKIEGIGVEPSFTTWEMLKWNKNSFEGYYITQGVRLEYKTNYYTKNNYIHVTKSEHKTKLENGEIISKSTVSNDPYTRLPSGKVCKGQSWVDSYKWTAKTTYADGKESTGEDTYTYTYTIEDINVLKTVEAGEFSTYVTTSESNDSERIRKSWIDIETGEEVYSETIIDGVVLGGLELIEITR